jgi:hypothetical protein
MSGVARTSVAPLPSVAKISSTLMSKLGVAN